MNVTLFRFLVVLLISLGSGVLVLALPISVYAEPRATTVKAARQQEEPPLLSNIQTIASGYNHTCALTAGGGVKCWGDNYFGQLGDGTMIKRWAPIDVVGLSSGVQAIAAGGSHTCVLTVGGEVKCWGNNLYSQLGDGTNTDRFAPVDVVGLSGGVQAIAAGLSHTCALTADGGVKCWGYNYYGELGDGTAEYRWTPIDVVGLSSGVQAVAAGWSHTCALMGNGGVKCWGRNDYGQLGDGTSEGRSTPVDVGGLSGGVQAIAASERHTCASMGDGGVKCWGDNYYGQLGDGTTTTHLTPTSVIGVAGIDAISGGTNHTCALTKERTIKCWGRNIEGQLGDGTTTFRFVPVDVVGLSIGIQAVAAGWSHTCALTASGEVKCWGGNWLGQLGNGTTKDHWTPVDVTGLSTGIQAVAAGWSHTCALTSGGGVKCWGRNVVGELGDGTAVDRWIPVDVVGLNSGVRAIAAGADHTCALTVNGRVKCWGNNGNGELGDGTMIERWAPVDVVGLSSGVQAIAAGAMHTCAITASGGVECWGWNHAGQLGDGTKTDRWTPVDVVGLGSGVQAIAAAWGHTCALTVGGEVRCWGGNWNGQLGDGTTEERLTSVDVIGLSSGVQAITAGVDHTCALTVNGGVKCWGNNETGQLGDGTDTKRLAPVDVVGLSSGVQAIAASFVNTCALTVNGGVKCWGENRAGQIGNGTTDNYWTPVDVTGLIGGMQAIAAGGYHICALTTGAEVKCWGDNEYGQLGVNPGWTPVDVLAGPSIRGRVLEIDLDPIVDAAVTYVAPSGRPITLHTDAAGIFTFTAVTTGMYTITVEKPPYSFFPDVMRCLGLSDQCKFQVIGAQPPDDIPFFFLPRMENSVADSEVREIRLRSEKGTVSPDRR